MKIRQYQVALVTLMAVCITLATMLAYVLSHRGLELHTAASEDPVIARGPAVVSDSTARGTSDTEPSAPGSNPPLAPIQLTPRRLQEIGVTTAEVTFKDVNDKLDVPGNVDIDEEKLAYVQTHFPGWIQDVYANATYQYVRKGDRLFTVYSPDVVSSEQEYLLALQNEKSLSPQKNESSEVNEAGAGDNMAVRESGWLLRAAEERLRQFGIPGQVIIDLEKTGKAQRNIAINSPVAGYITERNALPNAYVQPDTRLYTIADLSTIWVYANVFQDAVGRLRPGDPAQVTVDAYPGRTFSGHIDQILPQVDVTTRTVRVRLAFRNQGVSLKPGMYVNVHIYVPLGQHLVIPASAVLQTGQKAIAFIDHGQGYLEPRTILVGPQIDDSVVVLSGLKLGERVVSSANFLVDSEAQLQASLNGFTPPQLQTESASNPPTAKIRIDLQTQPDPLRKGENTLIVRLTGPDGKPVTGVQVTAVFVMPAMPAMGMGAEHVSAKLTEGGNGSYQGRLQLPSGGTWQATVNVMHGARAVARMQLSVDVTGGME